MNCCPPPPNTKNFYGNSDIQRAARKVFPLLIERATNGTRRPFYYGQLAKKIGLEYMPGGLKDPKKTLDAFRSRWMGHPLGSIWKTLFEYQQEVDFDIPYLMTIVVNQESKLPTIFQTYCNWSEAKIKRAQKAVYDFEKWQEVKGAICNR